MVIMVGMVVIGVVVMMTMVVVSGNECDDNGELW